MADSISRRSFAGMAAGLVLGSGASLAAADDPPKPDLPKAPARPTEAAFERDYAAPGFNPSWKKPQINRLFVQDFVIYAHSDLDMVKKLLEKESEELQQQADKLAKEIKELSGQEPTGIR